MLTHIIQPQKTLRVLLWVFATLLLISGCGIRVDLSESMNKKLSGKKPLVEDKKKQEISTADKKHQLAPATASEYYGKFFDAVKNRSRYEGGVNPIEALDSLPLDGTTASVNWTAAVIQGLIAPRAAIDPKIEDQPPLDLNIFIEAKVPLMANVIFPHSIHTYWLSCGNCHPKIFLPEAGANPISMKEIWEGKWCGRCHGKVAFSPFMPRGNCTRCHMLQKRKSLQREEFK